MATVRVLNTYPQTGSQALQLRHGHVQPEEPIDSVVVLKAESQLFVGLQDKAAHTRQKNVNYPFQMIVPIIEKRFFMSPYLLRSQST